MTIPTTTRRLLVALALVSTLTTGAFATAEAGPQQTGAKTTATGAVTDPDDTSGPLDVRRVAYRAVQVDSDHYRLAYRVRTFSAFASDLLKVDERTFVLDLNRDGEPGAEREVRVASRAGRLVAEVISPATRDVIGTVDVSRPNDHAIRLSGPRRVLGARSYFWTSNYHVSGSSNCGDWHGHPLVCQDDVPGDTWLRMDRAAWPQAD